MPRFRVLQRYRSTVEIHTDLLWSRVLNPPPRHGLGTRALLPLQEGEVLDLSEDEARFIERDAPGTLEPVEEGADA